MKQKILAFLLVAAFITLFFACKKDDIDISQTTISADFESGSIGEVNKLSNTQWQIQLANDNNATDLPDNWRNWWYTKMDNVVTDSITEIQLSNRGWPYYYLPVFSYNQDEWYHFAEDEVSQTENNELIIKKRFEEKTVWIARFYPYTYSDLENYIQTIGGSEFLDIKSVGSSQNGKPIYVLTLSNFGVPVTDKKRIIMHARTHPAETCPSFLLEGMINYLLSGTPEATDMLSNFEFHIFPMQNPDGVIAGNYRTTPQTENLEVMWYYKADSPLELTEEAPVEVTLIQEYARDLMEDDGPAVSMALNLHSSNSEPDICPFFFSHFGSEELGYSPAEAALWTKQIRFISAFIAHHGAEMIEPIPTEGGSSFASKTYPESWWWVNYKDSVMAMTMEMTYGRSGYSPKWIEPDDLRELGVSLALAINDYYEQPTLYMFKSEELKDQLELKYPELYPPNAIDELKE